MKFTFLFLILFIFSKNSQSQITDIDGNAYDTVQIGNQVWLTKNLNVTKFCNGDSIPEAKTDDEWIKAGQNKQPAWCYYNSDPLNEETYGKLYNYYAVKDPRGLAPKGFHMPSDTEWHTLINFLDPKTLGGIIEINTAGKKMKSTSGGFDESNGTNESGFSGLPGGFRLHTGHFTGIGSFGLWIGSNDGYMLLPRDGLEVRHFGSDSVGLSVRCLKD